MATALGRTGTRVCAMVGAFAALTLGSLTLLTAPHAAADTTQVPGMDVSGYQGNVDWNAAWAAGARFAYVKATEGTGYRNPYFAQQYNGSYQVGMIRGAYHFARPDVSDGATQADYFVAHGGGWTPDGRTLPPMLDIEYNPYGQTCYGLSQPAMVDWVRSFSDEVHARTTRWPMLYTTTDWWTTCTGNSPAFGDTHPLFIARYATSAGTLPSGWRYYTMWQYSDSGNKPGDQDTFNGSMDQLIKFAGGDSANTVVTTQAPATTSAPPTTTTQPAPTTTTTTSTAATTTTSTSARNDPGSSTTTAPPSTTADSAPAAPATTTATVSGEKPISGLVWAAPHNANPPASLQDKQQAAELVAQVEPPPAAAGQPVATTTSTVVPAPPATQAEPQRLASTGTNAARNVVFGAALLLLGVILLVLARAVRPRRPRRS